LQRFTLAAFCFFWRETEIHIFVEFGYFIPKSIPLFCFWGIASSATLIGGG
jgi:hypothetical protein